MTADEGRTGPSSGHADLDTLADLHAGVLTGAAAERVREHVAGCRQCAGALEAFDVVQGQLRSLPAPAMPADVAARLDAALVDLRNARPASAVPAGASVSDPEDELALARVRRGRRLSRAIGAVAAAVVVVAGGGAVVSIVRAGGGSDNTAAGGAGSAASAPVRPDAAEPGAKADGGSFNQAGVPSYDRTSLRAALPTIAARGLSQQRTAVGDPTQQEACARSIPGPAGSLRGVERIAYQSRPAFVFVYADGARLTGYVVTLACGSTPGVPATVLDTVS